MTCTVLLAKLFPRILAAVSNPLYTVAIPSTVPEVISKNEFIFSEASSGVIFVVEVKSLVPCFSIWGAKYLPRADVAKPILVAKENN